MSLKSDFDAANYLLKQVPHKHKPRAYLPTLVLSPAHVAVLEGALDEDARRYLYNGCSSFLSGLGSFHNKEMAWTVAKMYYTVFYLARASLCLNRFMVFHVPKGSTGAFTHVTLHILPGAKPQVPSDGGSTHKFVARMFKQWGYPAFMRGLQIGEQDPIEWMMFQREYWQYRCGRFPDPASPEILQKIDPSRLSLLLETYMADDTGSYLADESHALVSLPFRLLQWAFATISFESGRAVDSDDVKHLRKRCQIGKQRLSAVERLLIAA